MEKKVLVTGATGFIGKYAIRKLLDSGYEVVAIVRKKSTDLGRDKRAGSRIGSHGIRENLRIG